MVHTDADLTGTGAAPWPLWIIALLGLSPFPASAATYVWGPSDLMELALTVMLTWSAVMLGFLGGIRWGLESGRVEPRWPRLAVTVLSPIAGWILLFSRGAIDTPWLLCGFLAAFILQWLFDHTAPDVPARYPRLMTTLTLGAGLSLAVALEHALSM